ncbi:MAG: EamA family transporter RarD [Fibrobacteria bacterium]|nr:EamA family transporter RarD [Fibrobacteria bacterium]
MIAGVVSGLVAYAIWGLFPLYFRQLQGVDASQVVAHRVVWSTVLLAAGLTLSGGWRAFAASARSPGTWGVHALTAALIASNWLLYVWGVNADRVVDCSLGYFLNPLVSIGLGVVVLGERLRAAQWIAFGFGFAGILSMAWSLGTFPLLSLGLATSFGLYGLLKKRASMGSVHGLMAETSLLALPALVWIGMGSADDGFHIAGREWVFLAGTGVATTVPLLLFAVSTRRIPLAMVGFLQYLTPTMQLLIGVLAFGEPFGEAKRTGFLLVWIGLAVLILDSLLRWRSYVPSRSSPSA